MLCMMQRNTLTRGRKVEVVEVAEVADVAVVVEVVEVVEVGRSCW